MTTTFTVHDSEPASSPNQSELPTSGAWSDWVGMIASIGCAIHCAAMPFVIAYLPALGLSFLADKDFHKWMALGCFVIALVAFIPGFGRHGRLTPIVVASFGLMMIWVAAFGYAGECCPTNQDGSSLSSDCTDASCPLCAQDRLTTTTANPDSSSASPNVPTQLSSPWMRRVIPWLTPLGGIVLVSAHLLNRRFGCLYGCCCNESSDEGC